MSTIMTVLTPLKSPFTDNPEGTSSYQTGSHWFLRGLSVIYLVAFLSLGVQVSGLIGSQGITPANLYLERIATMDDVWISMRVPSIFWIDSGDTALMLGWIAGIILSLIALCGIGQAVCFGGLYLLYLSFTSVSVPWLNFQWDILLLEVTVISIFLSPAPWRKGSYLPSLGTKVDLSLSHHCARWCLRLLLFKLMFMSGVVKLTSGDPTWWSLRALSYHYETQPLPTPVTWWLHQLPDFIQAFCCAVMFVIEILIPFLIFIPAWGVMRKWRPAALRFAVGAFILL